LIPSFTKNSPSFTTYPNVRLNIENGTTKSAQRGIPIASILPEWVLDFHGQLQLICPRSLTPSTPGRVLLDCCPPTGVLVCSRTPCPNPSPNTMAIYYRIPPKGIFNYLERT
ncbi:unnamed protein product, partial [Ectocarpus sp. 8 AP-2014]